jgi:hypothetical protein
MGCVLTECKRTSDQDRLIRVCYNGMPFTASSQLPCHRACVDVWMLTVSARGDEESAMELSLTSNDNQSEHCCAERKKLGMRSLANKGRAGKGRRE